MLPYTTYQIPETSDNKTIISGKWLWMIVRQPLSPQEEDLLLKIAAALKADFVKDVVCLPQDAPEAVALPSSGTTEPRLIISFGTLPADLGIWIDLSRPGICLLESMTFILTIPIDKLATNTGAKKELWTCMQTFMERN
jgi:hypothetical protein